MVDEQELHHVLLCLDCFGAMGMYHHTLSDRCGTGWHRLGLFFNLNHTHAATGNDGELLVVAEMRNVAACLLGSMYYHAASGNFNLFSVNFDFRHGV